MRVRASPVPLGDVVQWKNAALSRQMPPVRSRSSSPEIPVSQKPGQRTGHWSRGLGRRVLTSEVEGSSPSCPTVVVWPSGEAAGCKPVHAGSTPATASGIKVCDGSSVAEQRLPNPRCRGFDSFLSRWSSGGPQAPGSLDVYPNRVTGSRRKRDAFRLWGFESLGVHSGRSSPPYREVAQRAARRRRKPEVAGSNPAFPTVGWVAQSVRVSEIVIGNAEYASMVQVQNDGFVVRRWGFESLYLL